MKVEKQYLIRLKEIGNIPLNQWCIGKIEKSFVGKDTRVRGAELTGILKSGGKTLYQRPIKRLLPLEIIADKK